MTDMGGALRADTVCIHYTGPGSFAGALSWLRRKDDVYVSAHKLIGRNGQIESIVPLDRVAYHAGKSEWLGRTALNRFSIGIELENPGYKTLSGPDWPTMRARHRNGGPVREWYLYPDAQIDALLNVLGAIGIKALVGHDHVSPGRKLDPGPAFPWARLQDAGYLVPEDVRARRI